MEMEVLTDGDLFKDFGLDSLLYAELISHMEEYIGKQIHFGHLIDWSSVKSISGLSQYIYKISSNCHE
jgi:acyl carrier protein